MDKKLDEIAQDLKIIRKDIEEIKLLDVRQNTSLEAHMFRTELNEKRIEKLEDYKWLIGLITATLTVIGAFLILIIKG